jgi:hypothetical protein
LEQVKKCCAASSPKSWRKPGGKFSPPRSRREQPVLAKTLSHLITQEKSSPRNEVFTAGTSSGVFAAVRIFRYGGALRVRKKGQTALWPTLESSPSHGVHHSVEQPFVVQRKVNSGDAKFLCSDGALISRVEKGFLSRHFSCDSLGPTPQAAAEPRTGSHEIQNQRLTPKLSLQACEVETKWKPAPIRFCGECAAYWAEEHEDEMRPWGSGRESFLLPLLCQH